MAKSALNSSCNGSKSRRTANRTNRKVVRPFLRVTECVQNWSFSSLYCKLAQHKGNHKGPYRKYEYIGLFSRFSTHIHTLLGSTGTVMWTGKLFHPKALLAVVGTVPTQTMILPPSIPAQEEHSFQVPFLASKHSPLTFLSGAYAVPFRILLIITVKVNSIWFNNAHYNKFLNLRGLYVHALWILDLSSQFIYTHTV